MSAPAGNKNVLDVDPRTGVRLQQLTDQQHVEVQGKFREYVIYFYGEVNKINRKWQSQKRTLVINESFLLLLAPGSVQRKREILIKEIEEIIIAPDDPESRNLVGLKCSPLMEYDCCMGVKNAAERDRILDVIVATSRYLVRIGQRTKPPVEVRSVFSPTGERLRDALKLKRPTSGGYSLDRIMLTRQEVLVGREAEFNQPLPNEADTPQDTAYLPPQPSQSVQPYGASPQDQENSSHVVQIFNQVHRQLIANLAEYRMAEIEEARNEVLAYVDMIDERDREIENLRATYLSLTENPEFWRSCPNCKEAAYDAVAGAAHADPTLAKKRQLEKKLEEYKDLINHMQMSRAAGGVECLHINSEVATLKKDIEGLETKVRLLQRLIIEHPYPTEDVRIRADQIAEEDVAYLEDTQQAKRHQADIAEMQRRVAAKDKELRHCKNVLRDAFKRQVQELAGIRRQFQLYDEHIVAYLEKVFAGNAYPQGPQSIGQTPKQLAQASSQAARQAATPPAFPQHTASVNMPRLVDQRPFSDRYGTRSAASPIGTFVPPNVISPPSPSDSPFYPSKEREGSGHPATPHRDPIPLTGFPGSAPRSTGSAAGPPRGHGAYY